LVPLRTWFPTLFPYTTLFRSPGRDRYSPRRGHTGRASSRRLALGAAGRTIRVATPRPHGTRGPDEPRRVSRERGLPCARARGLEDRKSTRLNSSHQIISYAVF